MKANSGGALMSKVAIVTGSSQGIGKQIALTLAKKGYDLVLTGLEADELVEVQSEIENLGQQCMQIAGDITDPEFSQKLVNDAKEKFGHIDALVNDAGMMKRTKTLETSVKDWELVIKVNLTGSFIMSKMVLPVMVEQQEGSIVNITSANGVTPHPNAAASYGASKAGLNYLTKHFALEFAGDHIRVNSVQCGPIATEMTKQWSQEYRDNMLKKIPLHKLGEPEDVAEAVAFMLSDKAGFITGSILNLSGGKLMQ